MGDNKTKSYTIDAVNRYNSKFDRIMASFPPGTKERIKELTGMSANKYITSVVLADLEKLEKSAGAVLDQEQKQAAAPQDIPPAPKQPVKPRESYAAIRDRILKEHVNKDQAGPASGDQE